MKAVAFIFECAACGAMIAFAPMMGHPSWWYGAAAFTALLANDISRRLL